MKAGRDDEWNQGGGKKNASAKDTLFRPEHIWRISGLMSTRGALSFSVALFSVIALSQSRLKVAREVVSAKASCSSLKGLKIAVSRIGLPTAGASIGSAVRVQAAGR